MSVRASPKPCVNVITLGCAKNIVDSEQFMAQLLSNQFPVMHEGNPDPHQIVVINTCGFIEAAKQESIHTILEFAALRRRRQIKRLYVTGCLSQRYRDQLKTEIPEVDGWFGTMELAGLLKQLGADYRHDLIGEYLLTTGGHYAYVKIAEGCNRTCSFCAIPLMRGKHVSRPLPEIIHHVQHLAGQGVKEIILIAQELTYYGLDLYKKRMLATLLDRLAEVPGIEWIRLHYAYPAAFPLDVLDAMMRHSNICKYLDLPIQHITDRMLARMHRQITKKQILALLDTIREKIPGITLRTTLLLGFPGETDADFEALLQFVEHTRFDRLGVFTYSAEEGTAAYALPDDVPTTVKQQRANHLMAVQQDISLTLNQKKIGRQLRVLIDRSEGDYLVGRTEADSPEIDHEVWVPSFPSGQPGAFYDLLIVDAEPFDLHARLPSAASRKDPAQ